MDNEYGLLIEWGIRISVAIVTAIVASWITLQFARKRFVSEKLWEKRAEAYGAILEALHDMKRTYDEDLNAQSPHHQYRHASYKQQPPAHCVNRGVGIL